MATNYVVVLAGIAARFATEAGVPGEVAGRIYLPMITGAAENLQGQSAAAALTGPVRRGDVATLQAHLEAIPLEDRPLYARLGLEALKLAREAGLDEAKAVEVERVLRDGPWRLSAAQASETLSQVKPSLCPAQPTSRRYLP